MGKFRTVSLLLFLYIEFLCLFDKYIPFIYSIKNESIVLWFTQQADLFAVQKELSL